MKNIIWACQGDLHYSNVLWSHDSRFGNSLAEIFKQAIGMSLQRGTLLLHLQIGADSDFWC